MASFSYSIVGDDGNPLNSPFESAGDSSGGVKSVYYAAEDPGKARQLLAIAFTASQACLYKDQSYGTDQWVESTIGGIEAGSGNWLGLLIRGTLTDSGATSTISGYGVRIYSGDSELFRIDGGSVTSLSTETATSFVKDDEIRIAVRPDGTIEVFHNWTGWGDTVLLTSTTTTSGSNLTGAHMGAYFGFNSNQSWWDILQGADDVPSAGGGGRIMSSLAGAGGLASMGGIAGHGGGLAT